MRKRLTRRAFLVLGLGFVAGRVLVCSARAGERTPVESSSIASVGYDAATHVLEIEFKNGGLYRYRAVPREIFIGLMSADSKGHFFLERIRGKFDYERVTAEAKP